MAEEKVGDYTIRTDRFTPEKFELAKQEVQKFAGDKSALFPKQEDEQEFNKIGDIRIGDVKFNIHLEYGSHYFGSDPEDLFVTPYTSFGEVEQKSQEGSIYVIALYPADIEDRTSFGDDYIAKGLDSDENRLDLGILPCRSVDGVERDSDYQVTASEIQKMTYPEFLQNVVQQAVVSLAKEHPDMARYLHTNHGFWEKRDAILEKDSPQAKALQRRIDAISKKDFPVPESKATKLFLAEQEHPENIPTGHYVELTVETDNARDKTGTVALWAQEYCKDFLRRDRWQGDFRNIIDRTEDEALYYTAGKNTICFTEEAWPKDDNKTVLRGVFQDKDLDRFLRRFEVDAGYHAKISQIDRHQEVHFMNDKDVLDFCNQYSYEIDAMLQDCVAGKPVNGKLSEKAYETFGKIDFEKIDPTLRQYMPEEIIYDHLNLQDQNVKGFTNKNPTYHTNQDATKFFLNQEVDTMKRFGLLQEDRPHQYSVGKKTVREVVNGRGFSY